MDKGLQQAVAEEAIGVLAELGEIRKADIYILDGNTLHLIEKTPSHAQKKEQLFVDTHVTLSVIDQGYGIQH